jgi:hypothetical protein
VGKRDAAHALCPCPKLQENTAVKSSPIYRPGPAKTQKTARAVPDCRQFQGCSNRPVSVSDSVEQCIMLATLYTQGLRTRFLEMRHDSWLVRRLFRASMRRRRGGSAGVLRRFRGISVGSGPEFSFRPLLNPHFRLKVRNRNLFDKHVGLPSFCLRRDVGF